MPFRATAVMAAAAALATPAIAQDLPDLTKAAESAASEIKSQAKESFLLKDLIGSDITSPSGDTAGKIVNLVALPGGRLVAVLVEPSGGGSPVPVPYSAVKVNRKGQKAAATLSAPLSELKGSDGMKALQEAVSGMSSGG